MGGARPVRAPRGTAMTCRSWGAEAALRMLHNNLDPEVAERPDDLVVYGGNGRAARSWEAFDAIVGSLRGMAPDDTLLVQSGKPGGGGPPPGWGSPESRWASSAPMRAHRASSSPTRCWCRGGRLPSTSASSRTRA